MHAGGMSTSTPRTAVCVGRVAAEQQGDGLLITLVLAPDIERISWKRQIRMGDIEAAMEVVRRFLVEFCREGMA